MYFIRITNMILFWLIFSLCQLLAQSVNQLIKGLKLTRLAAADVFGCAAPVITIHRVAICPKTEDECGFANWWLHDLKVVSSLHNSIYSFQTSLFRRLPLIRYSLL